MSDIGDKTAGILLTEADDAVTRQQSLIGRLPPAASGSNATAGSNPISAARRCSFRAMCTMES